MYPIVTTIANCKCERYSDCRGISVTSMIGTVLVVAYIDTYT